MTTLLTGGTGFIGAHVARVLRAHGERVRCLVRPTSRLGNLEGTGVEYCKGDLSDYDSLARAIDGCELVVHCAADYRLFAPDPREIYRSNVEGTENLLRAADRANVRRVVHTSSVGALGLEPDGRAATESTPTSLERMTGHYKRSKYLAEQAAKAWADRGLPVVIVNPSTPVGELDAKPTPTGQVIVDFLNRRMPAYVDTGLNFIDVRDVAMGIWLALQRGEPGERYILGHRNLLLKELFDILSAITGVRPPSIKLPHWVPLAFAAVAEPLARARGLAPRVALEGARMARTKMFFDAGKAVRELGLPQSPLEGALERAVGWFRDHGYAAA